MKHTKLLCALLFTAPLFISIPSATSAASSQFVPLDIKWSESSAIGASSMRLGSVVLFSGDDGESGNELWRTDGTERGTSLIRDINAGEESSDPALLFVLGKKAYFVADDGGGRRALWETTGTRSGTRIVFNFGQVIGDSEIITSYVRAGNKVFFIRGINRPLKDPDGNPILDKKGRQEVDDFWDVYVTDGTRAGTRRVLADVSGACELNVLGSFVLFCKNDRSNGSQLWRTDGTRAGTTVIKSLGFERGAYFFLPLDGPNNVIGSSTFFTVQTIMGGLELWKSDGTPEGTRVVKVLPSSMNYMDPLVFSKVGNVLVWPVKDVARGGELWRTDGTTDGTMLLKDINPGGADGFRFEIVTHNGIGYFGADDGVVGTELWKTDGTPEGTVLVKDIRVGSEESAPIIVQVVKGVVYVGADDGEIGLELWRTDGSAPGTTLVKDFNPGKADGFGGFLLTGDEPGPVLFATQSSPGAVNQLWVMRDSGKKTRTKS